MEEAAQRIRRLARDLCSDKPLGENSQKGKKKPGLSKPRNPVIPSGRSVIIGLEESQSYQRFAGCQQEVLSFI